MGLLPSLEIVSLAALTPCSLALTLRLSIRLPSVYSSCSPSLSSSLPLPLFTLSLSLFFSPFANSTNKCSAVLLIAFPIPLLFSRVPCSTTRNLFSRTRALRILQPADHIITLFIKPTATATIQSSSPPPSACRATLPSREGAEFDPLDSTSSSF